MGFPLFVVVAIAVLVAVNAYFWVRLFRDPGFSTKVRVLGAVGLFALSASIPLVRWLARWMPLDVISPLELVAFSWMGAAFFLLVALLAIDLFRAARWVIGRVQLAQATEPVPASPERRRLLATTAAAVAGLGTAGVSAAALKQGLGEVDVREVPVKLPKLPRALDGLTIVQLTDVHIGQAMIDRGFVDDIVARTMALRPDLVVITGDLVDGSVRWLAKEAAPLARLTKARFGAWFVTGNHEYFSGPDEWVAHLETLGIPSLRNRRVSIGDAASIDLAGVEDASGARWSGGGGGPDLARALEGRDPERALVLLAHQPKAIDEAAESGVCLQLSGHTHGGQIYPFGELVRLAQPYVAGLHHHTKDTQIYVSRGTGYWGPPMRLWAPAEITKIVLTT